MVKLKNELAVIGFAFFLLFQAVLAVGRKLRDLPLLALVLAEVLHHERLHAGDAEQALARGVDGESSQVTGNPAAVELFGDSSGCAGTAEAVEDDIPRTGTRF